jgi:CheY-like chemotaxis protein
VNTNGKASASGRILVVEDDPSAARFALIVLGARGGFEVACVADPAIAIGRIGSEQWDLALIDLDLPIMSGLHLAEQARRIRPGLPIAVITAMEIGPADQALLLRHADEVLLKPVPARQLITIAAGLIGRARTAQPASGAGDDPERPR